MAKKYVQGASIEEARRLSGLTEIVKLGSNENVLGPSPQAMEAIKNALPEAYLYPIQHEKVLLERLAARIGGGLTPENFVSGNGSCDVLRMITQTFMAPGKNAVIGAPTFSMYDILVNMFGGESIFVPLKDFYMDLDAMAAAVNEDTALVFLCNPNNPTGTIVTHDAAKAFLDKIPKGVIVVFDEAYMEFAEDPNFPRVTEFIAADYDVFVSRTFSKLYGLASLRVGYGFARTDLVEKVLSNRIHFNSGRLAFIGAAAAVEDGAYIEESMSMVHEGRRYYYREFDKMGIKYLPTESNFLFLVDLPMDANEICDKAMRKGVILRPTNPFGLPDNIRITIGRKQDNERVIEVLKEIIHE